MKVRNTVLALAAIAAGGALQAQPASALVNYIQPGDFISTSVGGCTLNFVYDGTGSSNSGDVYLGTAAHCVSSIGEDVSTTGHGVFGDVAWIGDQNDVTKDVALIKVRTGFTADVSDVVLGHYAPNGYEVAPQLVAGDVIDISGWGLGFDQTNTTRESRVAIATTYNDSLLSVVGPIDFGDSGGPLLHAENQKAIGIVSRICAGTQCPGSETGPTVQRLISFINAASSTFQISLR